MNNCADDLNTKNRRVGFRPIYLLCAHSVGSFKNNINNRRLEGPGRSSVMIYIVYRVSRDFPEWINKLHGVRARRLQFRWVKWKENCFCYACKVVRQRALKTIGQSCGRGQKIIVRRVCNHFMGCFGGVCVVGRRRELEDGGGRAIDRQGCILTWYLSLISI